jgi:uncharacterized protein YdhG (YjbR/CyaY superfamily)
MTSPISSPNQYIEGLPADRIPVIQKLRQIILEKLPAGFQECMSYGMIGYVVPHSLYPAGYHCDPKLPLPFLSLASQKNFIAIYHMGIYAEPNLMAWFQTEFAKVCKSKLDMGKSCIRFKKMDDIPFDLIGQLASKINPQEWIDLYTKAFRSGKENLEKQL